MARFAAALLVLPLALAACSKEPEVKAENASIAQVAAAIKQQMAQRGVQTIETCVTKEQAARPPEELLAGGADACRYDTFALKGGRLNAVMTCKGGPTGGDMRMTVAGDYGGTRYDLASTVTLDIGQRATVRTRVTGTRLGACP